MSKAMVWTKTKSLVLFNKTLALVQTVTLVLIIKQMVFLCFYIYHGIGSGALFPLMILSTPSSFIHDGI